MQGCVFNSGLSVTQLINEGVLLTHIPGQLPEPFPPPQDNKASRTSSSTGWREGDTGTLPLEDTEAGTASVILNEGKEKQPQDWTQVKGSWGLRFPVSPGWGGCLDSQPRGAIALWRGRFPRETGTLERKPSKTSMTHRSASMPSPNADPFTILKQSLFPTTVIKA